MISVSPTLTNDRFSLPHPEFQLDPPESSPFAAMATSKFTRDNNSFDLNWIENPVQIVPIRAEWILDDILARSERDVQRFPDNAQVHANYGAALLNRGILKQAGDECAAALRLSPRHFMSLANLARIRTLEGQFAAAESLYEELSAEYPGEVSPLVNLAYIAIRKEDFNRATFILERAISVDRDAILPRYLMAILLLKGGQPREAIGHLRIAARSDVRSIAVYQALGVAFVMLGEAKRAVRSFTSALALAADKQNAVRALSNVLLQNRQFEALSELLKEHLEKAPEDTVSRGLLAQSFLEQRQYPAARRQFLSVLRSIQDKGPDDAERKSLIMNNIGVCYDYEGNWEAAGRSFLKSIEVYPGYDNVAHHNLARLKIRQGRLDQAWRILKSCREGAPENHETPELQALVLEKQRRYEEAIELLVEEIRAGQATEGSYAYASGLLTDVNCDFDSACELAVEGLVRYPFAAILMNNLAYALLMNGQPVEARKILESIPSDAKSSRGDSPVVLAATWGLLYLWEGNIEKGQERYREAEALARTLPQHDLPNIVRQKMHLETARAYARQQDFAAADIEISRGLSVKDGRDLYSQDLTALSNELRNR